MKEPPRKFLAEPGLQYSFHYFLFVKRALAALPVGIIVGVLETCRVEQFKLAKDIL